MSRHRRSWKKLTTEASLFARALLPASPCQELRRRLAWIGQMTSCGLRGVTLLRPESRMKNETCSAHRKRTTPGQRAEGAVPTALGSFGVTVRGVRENAIREVGIVKVANGCRPACPALRPQPASCNAAPSANSGIAFPWRGCKAQRWRDTPLPERDSVRLDMMNST